MASAPGPAPPEPAPAQAPAEPALYIARRVKAGAMARSLPVIGPAPQGPVRSPRGISCLLYVCCPYGVATLANATTHRRQRRPRPASLRLRTGGASGQTGPFCGQTGHRTARAPPRRRCSCRYLCRSAVLHPWPGSISNGISFLLPLTLRHESSFRPCGAIAQQWPQLCHSARSARPAARPTPVTALTPHRRHGSVVVGQHAQHGQPPLACTPRSRPCARLMSPC